jgi:hypothetical protein
MRPTCLQFRSPKERTPDPYEIRVTCNGSWLGCCKGSSPSFGRDKRFRQYEEGAKKTGARIGPGSYSVLSRGKVRGGPVIRPDCSKKGNDECIYVGQSLVRDVSLPNKSGYLKQYKRKIEGSRPTTASEQIGFSPKRLHFTKKDFVYRSHSRNRLISSTDHAAVISS